MDYTDILRRMRAGETADTIAEDMAKMLNQAEQELEKERSKSKREKELKEHCAAAADALKVYSDMTNKNYDSLRYDGDMCERIIKTAVGISNIFTPIQNCVNEDDDFERAVEKFLRLNHID